MSPAEDLRAAATLLRRAFAALPSGQAAAWEADHYPEGSIIRPVGSTHSLLMLRADGLRAAGTPCLTPAVADYIAAMGPSVGTALADLLDHAARACDATVTAAYRVFGDDTTARDQWITEQTETPALAVARQILGSQE